MSVDLEKPEADMVRKDLEAHGAVVTVVAKVSHDGKYIFYRLRAEWPDGGIWEIREIQGGQT